MVSIIGGSSLRGVTLVSPGDIIFMTGEDDQIFLTEQIMKNTGNTRRLRTVAEDRR